MYPEGAKRRTVLKTVGASLASLGVIGTVSATDGHSKYKSVQEQLAEVEEATEQYKNIEVAVQDGYQIMGPYVPDMGWHLVKLDDVPTTSSEIELDNPTGLTYNIWGELGSVEYVMETSTNSSQGEAGKVPTEPKPNLFNGRGSNDLKVLEEQGWHPHYGAQHVYAKPGEDSDGSTDNYENASVEDLLNPVHWMELSDEHPMFPSEMDDLAVGDEVTLPWPPNFEVETRIVDGLIEHDDWWTLHAWVHFENPHGVFEPFNHNPDWDPLGGSHSH